MTRSTFPLFLLILLRFFLDGNAKQSAYRIIPDQARVSYVNPNYAEVHNWSFKRFNKTTGAFNLDFTFKRDIDESLYSHMVGLVFKNNEFKKTAFAFDIKLCPLFEHPEMFDIGHVLEDSNFTLKCPIKKGTYYIHNMIPDPANFPEFMPSGRWMYKQELKVKNAHFATLELVCRIEYLVQ